MLQVRACVVHDQCTEFYASQMNKIYVLGFSKIFLEFKKYSYPILRTFFFEYLFHPRHKGPPFGFGLSFRTILVEVNLMSETSSFHTTPLKKDSGIQSECCIDNSITLIIKQNLKIRKIYQIKLLKSTFSHTL